MAVHNLGYRAWSGKLEPEWSRLWVICSSGIRRAWQSRWLRRMMFFAWLPAAYFGFGFFIWEQSLLYPEFRDGLRPFLAGVQGDGPLQQIVQGIRIADPERARHTMWGWMLLSFFRYPQGVLMILVVGLIAPPLISQDVRSRAFLLYFSRPLSRWEYILGKTGTVWFYLALISTLPALSLYVLGVLLSPQLEVVRATWDLPLRIVAASAVLMVPTASLALCLSSMTQESRYAGFAWFAIWVLGWFTYGIMGATEVFSRPTTSAGQVPWRTHLSLYHTLGQVQSWVFGFQDFQSARLSCLILVVLTVLALIIVFRRVAAPMRA